MEANREYWRAVSVFTNYEVSSVGRVRNSETGRVLKPGKGGVGYLTVALCRNGIQKTHAIHQLVAYAFVDNPSDKPRVDHIDGNRVNNNSSNLCWASSSENGMNRCKQAKPTSSIYKGVYLAKGRWKWMAYINVGGKMRGLGYFTSEREAAEAYNTAATEHFGEFAKLKIFND